MLLAKRLGNLLHGTQVQANHPANQPTNTAQPTRLTSTTLPSRQHFTHRLSKPSIASKQKNLVSIAEICQTLLCSPERNPQYSTARAGTLQFDGHYGIKYFKSISPHHSGRYELTNDIDGIRRPDKNMPTSDVVGTRAFQNPWPVTTTVTTAYQQLDSQQPNPPAIPKISVLESYTESRERMAPTPLREKPPPTGIGITRFAGGTFFPPGPQKSYHRKRPLLGLQDNSLKSYLTISASGLSPDSPKEPPKSTAISRPNFFEQWRAEQDKIVDIDNGRLRNTNSRNDSGDDSSDEDGGVALASSPVTPTQGPDEVKLSLHQIAPESYTTNPHPAAEYLEPGPEEPKLQKVGIAKKKFPGPRPSINSRIAALLQTPGAANFGSRSPKIPAPPVKYPVPTQYPIYRANMEPEREAEEEEEEEEEDEIHERKTGSRLSIPNEPGDTPNPLAPSVDKYEDINASRYWRAPGTPFVYLRSTSTPLTTPQEMTRLPKPERTERPSRRAFRYLKDGDVVGSEATELSRANKGRLMMEKMGYKEGTTLGTSEDRGLIEPVRVEVRLGKRGLGLAKQESVFSTQTGAGQTNLSQMILPQTAPVRGYEGENTYAITRQFQQMDIIALQQAVKYSLATPLGACQTRLRMVQILAQLDASEFLNIVDYNYILAVSMDRVAGQQSRLGFLVDADLMQIVTMEYKMAVLRVDQRRGGNHGKNLLSYW